MPATPQTDPQAEILLMQKQFEQEREQAKQNLHEVTSAAKQTVNDHFLQMASETAKKEELARSAAAAAASTDEIRKQRGTLAWSQALAAELKVAREAHETAKHEATQGDNRAQDKEEGYWRSRRRC